MIMRRREPPGAASSHDFLRRDFTVQQDTRFVLQKFGFWGGLAKLSNRHPSHLFRLLKLRFLGHYLYEFSSYQYLFAPNPTYSHRNTGTEEQ